MFGIPHEEFGEQVHVDVLLKPGAAATATAQEVRTRVAAAVAVSGGAICAPWLVAVCLHCGCCCCWLLLVAHCYWLPLLLRSLLL